MRVHELANELDVESADVLAMAREAGVGVTHASESLSDDEAATLRAAAGTGASGPDGGSREADGADGGEDASAPKPKSSAKKAAKKTASAKKGGGPVLVGKATISCGGVVVRRGETAEAAWVKALPARLRACFDSGEGA